MIARRRLPVKQNLQSFLHCRKIAENRRKTQKRCNFNLQMGCGLGSKTIWNGFRFFRVAAPSIRIVPWAALASCWPLPQQLLPVSAAGGGRRRCTLGINSGKSIFYLQFRNACGRFETAFLRERLRWKASQAHIRLQPFFCVPKGCARAFLGLFRAIRCISGAIHAELLYFCRRSWYTTSTEQCSVQYAIPVIPIEQKTVR